jgi:capsular exopolysaccharide synthesis family protein
VAEGANALNLEKTLAVMRGRAWLILLCVAVVAGSAFGLSELQSKRFTTAAKLLFRDPGLDQQAAGVNAPTPQDPQRSTATNISLVTLGPVAARTARVAGNGLTAAEVRSSVEVSAEGATDIASVSATSSTPRRAALIANTFTAQFIASRREIDQARVLAARKLVERQISELSPQQRAGIQGQTLVDRSESLRILASLQTGNAELVERAPVPTSASAPKVKRNTILGAILGLLIGIGIAFLRDRLDRRMKEPEDLESAFGLPLLGVVPESGIYAATNGSAAAVLPTREGEAFRMLRAHLRYFNVDRTVQRVLVTSAASGEGKSTVSHHLAQAAASMGTKTLLIEADLRRPSLSHRLGVAAGRGLGDVLIGACVASEAIQSIAVTTGVNGASADKMQLDVLLAGATPPNPAELLESHAMEDLLKWASDAYELVIIDTPPLTVVSDAIPLLRKVDGVVIVSRLGVSTHDAAERMRERLKSLGAPVLGVVGNAYADRSQEGYGYGYYSVDTTKVS